MCEAEKIIAHPWYKIILCKLCTGSTRSQNHTQREAESILINVAGRLLLFQRDRSASAKTVESSDRKVDVVYSVWSCITVHFLGNVIVTQVIVSTFIVIFIWRLLKL